MTSRVSRPSYFEKGMRISDEFQGASSFQPFPIALQQFAQLSQVPVGTVIYLTFIYVYY